MRSRTMGPAVAVLLTVAGGAAVLASVVLLQARDPVEAVRLRATRLLVVRGGRVLARSAPAQATLLLPGRPAVVDWTVRRGG